MDRERFALESKDIGGNSQSGSLYPAGGKEGVPGAGQTVRSGGTCTCRRREKNTQEKEKGDLVCKYLSTSALQT